MNAKLLFIIAASFITFAFLLGVASKEQPNNDRLHAAMKEPTASKPTAYLASNAVKCSPGPKQIVQTEHAAKKRHSRLETVSCLRTPNAESDLRFFLKLGSSATGN